MFQLTLRVIQIVLVLWFLTMAYYAFTFSNGKRVKQYWSISDPYLVPEDDEYSLLSESVALQVGIKDQVFKNPKLKPERIGVYFTASEYTAWYNVIFWTFLVTVNVFTLIGVEQLRKMIVSALSENPFNRTNAKRIYIIASLFLLYPTLEYAKRWIISLWMNSKIELIGLEWSLNMKYELPFFLMGVFLITIGKIMERGVEIQEEQKLTV